MFGRIVFVVDSVLQAAGFFGYFFLRLLFVSYPFFALYQLVLQLL